MSITVWYSTESHADWLIANTVLSGMALSKQKLAESDANNAASFHAMPDHLKKILYLDCPDIIVEKDGNPLVSIEITEEAGTGHNTFQRFARIAAAVENNVPAIYIYPEGKVIEREDRTGWDKINPNIFAALERLISIYDVPALLYYYPSYFGGTPPSKMHKGLKHDHAFPACPDSVASQMTEMFSAVDLIISRALTAKSGRLTQERPIINHVAWMRNQFHSKAGGATSSQLSPLTATITVPTTAVTAYLSKYAKRGSFASGLLPSRSETVIYKVDAGFRGDPYPGALAAIDYLSCRNGKTFEERDRNLVLAWGDVTVDDQGRLFITTTRGVSANDFVEEVRKVRTNPNKCLLDHPDFSSLSSPEIPRYYMQSRYGCSFTKVKHLRVYSFFADAILFPDGAFWREG